MQEKVLKNIISILAVFTVLASPCFVNATGELPIGGQDVPTITVDFDDCLAYTDGTNQDYSELSGTSNVTSGCTQLDLVGGYVYRENELNNIHSCTEGLNGTVALCVGSEEGCFFIADSDKALRFDIEVSPDPSGTGSLDAISFYERAPEQFVWVDVLNLGTGSSGLNNYPTRYGIRVLKDGQEIYRQEDIFTEFDWNLESFDFSENPDFTVNSTTLFEIEILPYCVIGNASGVTAWDIEDLVITGGCAIVDGGDLTFEDGSTESDYCNANNSTQNLNVILTGSEGTNEFWVVTDLNETILGTVEGPPFDLSDFTLENCLLWHMSYEGEVTGVTAGEPVGNVKGCFDFSNAIQINKTNVDGGDISLINQDSEFETSTCFEQTIDVSLGNELGTNSAWVITDTNLNILDISQNPPFSLEGLAGFDFLIWHLSYEDGLMGLEVGQNAADLTGCFSLSNSVSVHIITENDLDILAINRNCDGETPSQYLFLSMSGADLEDNATVTWEISYDSGLQTFTGNPIELTTDIINSTSVTANVVYADGCSFDIQENISADDFEDLNSGFTTVVNSCSSIGTDISFVAPDYYPLGLTVESYSWTVTVGGGSVTSSDQTVNIILPSGGTAIVELVVELSDDCTLTTLEEVTDRDILPVADFDLNFSSCSEDGVVGVLTENVNNNGIETNPISYDWTITQNGDTQNLTGPTVDVDLDIAEVSISLVATYANGCAADVTAILGPEDLLPTVDINFEINFDDCSDGTNPTTIFSAISEVPITSYEWTITDGGQTIESTDSTISLSEANSDLITVSLTATLENGCVVTTENTYNDYDLLLGLDIQAVALECTENDVITLVYDNTMFPVNVVGQSWTINVMGDIISASGDSVEFVFPGFEGEFIADLIVELENGCTVSDSRTVDIQDLFPQLTVIATLEDCEQAGDPLTSTLSALVAGTAPQGASYQWEITNGSDIFTSTDETVSITSLNADELLVNLTVQLANGCFVETTQTFTADQLGLGLNIIAQILECGSDSYTISVSENSDLPSNVQIVSQSWTVATSNNTFTGNSTNIVFDLPVTETVFTVTEEVILSNGCSITDTREFDVLGDLLSNIDIDFTINLDDCVNGTGPSVDFFAVSENTIVSYSWTIVDGLNTYTGTNPTIELTEATADIITVTLTALLDNGCTAVVSESFNDYDLLLGLDIQAEALSCTESDVITLVYDNTMFPIGISSQSWSIDVMGDIITSEGDSVEFTFPGLTGEFEATLIVELANGCVVEDSRLIDITDLFPELTIVASLDDCVPGSNDLSTTLSALVAGETPEGASYEWEVIISDQIFTSTDPTFTIDNIVEDSIIVNLTVTLSNGCVVRTTQTFTPDQLGQGLDIEAEILDCQIGSYFTIVYDNSDFPANTEVVGYEWTIVTPDETITSTDEEVTFNLSSLEGMIVATLTATLNNGCVITDTEEFVVTDITPEATFNDVFVECLDNNVVVHELTAVSNANIENAQFEWTYVIEGDIVVVETGNPISVNLQANETIEVTLITDFGAGCLDTFVANVTGFSLIDFITDPIIDCPDDDTYIVANPNPAYTYVWEPTDGLTFTTTNQSNPIVNVTEETTYTVTVSDGEGCIQIFDIDVIPGDDLGDIEIEVVGDGPFCGEIPLTIVDPILNLTYQWSTDETFGTVLGEGDSFVYTFADGEISQTIYVQVLNADLVCGGQTGFIEVVNDNVVVEIFEPFIICPGDTTLVPIINLNPDQEVNYVFQDDVHIVSTEDNGVPTIGIGADETDPFELIFSATNNLGCEIFDTISFEIGMNDTLSFDIVDVDCNELTICFGNVTGNNGTVAWDFGDGNVAVNVLDTCHMYAEPGIYDVSIVDFSTVCPGIPFNMEVIVAEPIFVMVESDTIFYEDAPVTLTATTTENPDDIVWCDQDGNPIGNGGTITYTPTNDVEIVTAKISDPETGCDDAADVVLILDDPDRPDVGDIIGGPLDGETACPGDTFNLVLDVLDPDANYSYDWNPDDCLIAGEGTPNPTIVLGTEDKTLMVTVVDLDTGMDTTVTTTILVDDFSVTITADPDDPIVVEGTEIDLSVENIPGAIYEWSDGANNSSTIVIPTGPTVYTVSVTNENGCTATDTYEVTEVLIAMCDESDIYLPTAFSPNNDGVNDDFYVRSNFIETMELTIYDRWGEEIFITTDQNTPWEGVYKGETLHPDVFAYCLKVVCINGEEYVTTGNVSLIK